jgi:Tfp pilus assembly PilM family ATPase
MYFFKDRFKNIHNTDATIGLDIGSSMIKWVNLGCNHEFKHYAIQAISTPMGAQAKNATQIAVILKRTLLAHKHIRNCIVNIPDIFVCSKWMQIDNTDSRHIGETIKLLIERSIPYPLHKLYFDYQLFEASPKSQKKGKVLIVACRKEHLDFRLDIIQQANLIPIAVEVSSFALERGYRFFYPDKMDENTILLDIGASQLALLFFNSSQAIVYSEKLLNVFEQESILLQIKRGIKSYALTHPYLFLKQLFIIGSNNSLLSYLRDKLDRFLDLTVQSLKHQNQIKYSTELNKDKLEQKFLNLFLSYGLALRKINSDF